MLYIISIILLFVLILIVPKSKEKLNLIKTIIITLVTFFAYNTFICYILNFVNIPITLLSLSIVNFIVSVLLICKIIKDKEIQKYEIKKRDIIACLALFIMILVCICINFRGLTRIRYISMDSVQHYKAAREFSENTTLFNKATENSSTSKSHMPMGYVNVGILFKVFRPLVGVVYLYKIYILFEATIYFLAGIMFYYCIEKLCKTKYQIIIGILFSIVYLIGYPLNSLISGFHYLLIGILYFTAILYVMKELIILEKINFLYSIIILSLLNIGLIFSYALFCPPIYLAEFAYFIYKYRKDKNKKHLILFIIITLILTGLMGCDIILYQRIKAMGETGIKLEGWIYKNDWSNIILFMPFTIYYIVKIAKKENIFEKSLLVFFIIFFIVLAIGNKIGICSSYYFYKNSYILWMLILYTALKAIICLANKKNIYKDIINIFTIFYISLLIISILSKNTYIKTEGKTDENMSTIMEIFTLNLTNMKVDSSFISKQEIEAIKEADILIESKWKEKDLVLVLPNPTQSLWVKALTGYEDTDNSNIVQYINKWNNNEYKYLILLNKRQPYETVKEMLKLDDSKIMYQNEEATIYLRNGE